MSHSTQQQAAVAAHDELGGIQFDGSRLNLEFMWDELDKSGFVVLSVFLFLFDEREANEHYVSHACLV